MIYVLLVDEKFNNPIIKFDKKIYLYFFITPCYLRLYVNP